MTRGIALLIVSSALGCAPANASAPASAARDGTTEVQLESHLPDGLTLAKFVASLDGETIYFKSGDVGERTLLYRAALPPGDHTLVVSALVLVPCGLTGTKHERILVKNRSSFELSSSGGVVRVWAFGRAPWLAPEDRVRLDITHPGIGSGNFRFSQSELAREVCGDPHRAEFMRCVASTLLEQARIERDVVRASCRAEKLASIDRALASADEGVTLTRIEELGREAEDCSGDGPQLVGEQQLTQRDGSACEGFAPPVPPL